jgi:tetraacyldisaccharide 4'-kinase
VPVSAGQPVSWTRVTAFTVLLIPLSWLYRAAVALRRGLYRASILRGERLPVPVIVVGNVSVGGTGKTPLVLWLAERLRAAGYTPGIVSRGYGGAGAHTPRAAGANDDPAQCGDEALLLARLSGCPVWIGANRPAAARALLAAHPRCNVIVSDDGLQHYVLARDAEIAVIDGARGHGNGCLLPAGPLREPVSRLASVDAVVIRGDDITNAAVGVTVPRFAMHMAPGVFRNLRDPRITRGAEQLRGPRVHAAAGIGNPGQFFDTLKNLGLAFTAHAFADHHPYAAADLAFGDCDTVLMTGKDAVKYERYVTDSTADKYWALDVAAQIDNQLATLLIERITRSTSQGKT